MCFSGYDNLNARSLVFYIFTTHLLTRLRNDTSGLWSVAVHYGEIEETKFEYLVLLSLGFKPKPCDVFAIYVISIVIYKVVQI